MIPRDTRDGLSINNANSRQAVNDAQAEKGASYQHHEPGSRVIVRLPHMARRTQGVPGVVVRCWKYAVCWVVEVDLGEGPAVKFAADRITKVR